MPLTVNFTLKTFCTVSPIKKQFNFQKSLDFSVPSKVILGFDSHFESGLYSSLI